MKTKNLLVGIYFHPEAYPPTLNAVSALSDSFDGISILHRPHLRGNWQYPENVVTYPSGRYMPSREQETAPLLSKIGFFLRFLVSFFRLCIRKKPRVILVYDTLSLFAYHLLRPFLFFPHIIWYHNHDVAEEFGQRKYSIGWFAVRAEKKVFAYLDIFSLPSNDRLVYFPMNIFRGKYFFLPNFPSINFYSKFYHERRLEQPLKLIFQGSVGPFHGIEEIIQLLPKKLGGFDLELVLKGPCSESYGKLCQEMAASFNVTGKLRFEGVTPYSEVPAISSQCHIGIGLLGKQDLMNKTLGTASNKIYEYAAVGLPVIYYASSDFTQYLGKYDWAVPALLEVDSIRQAILRIIENYTRMSEAARKDFLEGLNYELGFVPIRDYLQHII